MDQFEYKIMFSTQKVTVSKEMIEHNGKTIPAPSILGIGISLINVTKIAVGQAVGGALGGLIGGAIKAGSYSDSNSVNKSGSIKDLPDSRGQLVITYNPEGHGTTTDGAQKMKVERIVINSADPVCRKMLEKVVETYKSKFIGFGPQVLIEKELNISHKAALIFAAIVILGILAFGIYSAMNPGSY